MELCLKTSSVRFECENGCRDCDISLIQGKRRGGLARVSHDFAVPRPAWATAARTGATCSQLP